MIDDGVGFRDSCCRGINKFHDDEYISTFECDVNKNF